MPDGPVTTDDIPLEHVHSFAALRAMLIRLHDLVGRPGAGEVKRFTAAAPGLVTLSRNRVVRILRGPIRPSRDELRALLHAYGVPEDQRRRWDEAWARAAGERRLRPPAPRVPDTSESLVADSRGAESPAAESRGAGSRGAGSRSADAGAAEVGSAGSTPAEPHPAPRSAESLTTPRSAEPRSAPLAAESLTAESLVEEGAAGGAGGGRRPAPEEDPRAASARRMLEVRERCAERLRRLKNELVASRAQTDLDDPAASTQLVRSLDFALRRLQDIIDEACTEVLATVPTTATATPISGRPAARSPSTRDATGAGEPAGGSPAEPEDQALAWLSAVQDAVPLPIVANLLRVMRDVPMFNHIAQERPLLMTELLAVLPPVEASRWLQTWEPESAAETLAVAEPARAAAHVTLMPPEAAATLLVRVSQRRSVAILAEMRSEPAARLLIAMGPSIGAALLDRMERGAATIRLQLIDELDPALCAKFLSLMSEEAASESLSRMDHEKAKRRQARDLLEGIGDQRPEHKP
ncbi:magnesium transporter MgtE N-terminal domain-containing protein [Rugosimonospora africana]|uniref:HTH cro/C1-type domain-containing protein n=1 Tax=Rugosimonospora africana TaxID=556532 RepID=A0A8J3VST5_9ACTN|nr:helix-turn-helix domain-containing protein [Rugosimonospora africana]GIH17470.1 hypothetical protein Raf01_56420 [Rugosimonospora africana]